MKSDILAQLIIKQRFQPYLFILQKSLLKF